MLHSIKNAFLGDFLKNFQSKGTVVEDSDDADVIQLKYTLR